MNNIRLTSWLLCLLFPFGHVQAQETHWECNISDYEYDMTVYLDLQVDGQLIADRDKYEVAAFCGDDCRGVAVVERVEGISYYYLRVRSNQVAEETFSIKVYEKETDKEFEIDDSFNFIAQGLIGYPSSPKVLEHKNTYKITFTIDGEIIAEDFLLWNSEVTTPEEPTKEGHTFSGWSEAPETMPAEDVIVSGTFTVNKYLVTFKIGDEVVASDSLEYGASIVAPEAPEKEGHTFNGWGEVPETVPAHDLTYMGSYSVNSYLLTFTVDGETVQTDSVTYGTAITLPEEPTKEGHTFSGWSEVPETMPAEDVIVSGTFTVNKYLVTFKIGDEVIASDSLDYGASIVAPEAPEKEGHTFNGWGEVPETVPAHDLTYTGSYSVNSYLLTFTVDGEIVQTDSVTYGTAITLPEEPTKEGHTFSGWSKTPETMPAHDVTVSGTFSVNQYTVTYIIDGEVFATYTINYGENITMPDVPEREGYDFAWVDEIPETMPAKDIVINGAYTPISSIADITNANEVLYIYTINGQRIDELQEGLNIVLMKDGNIRKVLVK